MKILMAILLFGAPVFSLANQKAETKTEKIIGTASKEKKLVYTENHEVSYDGDRRVITAKTVYKDATGKAIAEISSDFSKSLSAPAHDFKDLRFDQQYGIRYQNDKLFMYVKEAGKGEEVKEVPASSGDALLVGCQGLAYYFQSQWKELQEKKIVPILFLIPGRLETYNFELKYLRTDASGIADFEIKIKNLFLRLFAPSIRLKYDTKKNRLVTYSGLSNLYDDKKNMQNVDIQYTYEDGL